MRRALMITVLVILLAIALMILMASVYRTGGQADADTEQTATEYAPSPLPEPTPEPVPEDVYLLAKIMQCEAGVDWPDWAVMLIGEVVFNRVESWRFPNSVHDVIYANNPVQYEPVYSSGWDEVEPDPEYIDLAWRLVNGERALGDPDVVFQALFPQGTKTVVTFYDRALDTRTYFCKG